MAKPSELLQQIVQRTTGELNSQYDWHEFTIEAAQKNGRLFIRVKVFEDKQRQHEEECTKPVEFILRNGNLRNPEKAAKTFNRYLQKRQLSGVWTAFENGFFKLAA